MTPEQKQLHQMLGRMAARLAFDWQVHDFPYTKVTWEEYRDELQWRTESEEWNAAARTEWEELSQRHYYTPSH